MNYQLTHDISFEKNQCIVIGFFSDKTTTLTDSNLDKKQWSVIQNLANKLKEPGDVIWQTNADSASLLLIDCGKHETWGGEALKKRIGEIMQQLRQQRINQATIALPKLTDKDANWQLEQMMIAFEYHAYELSTFKSDHKSHHIETIDFYLPDAEAKAIKTGQAIADGIVLARNLANLPANVCTPTYLGEKAMELANDHEHIHAKILEYKDIKALNMGAFLAVAQGSHEPPKFIELQYLAGGDAKPIVLVGKGVTFDAGGISLKPAEGMHEMKYDMAGAASVLGTLNTCALLNLPVNVIGLVPATENMPGGKALKPGDIIKSMSGQTIEITNTDAEGRLILADALTYAQRFNPKCVLDIATLTGAMIIALGYYYTGFMTDDDALAKQIQDAAMECLDKAWRIPLDKAYQSALDSPIADMMNASLDRAAGSITAASFLSRFTKQYPWAHFDIAGTAWVTGKNRHATGRPVALLVEFIRQASHAH